MTPSATFRYNAFSQLLHWVTAVLVLFAFLYGLGGSEARVYLPSQDFDRQLHETLGMSVFVLSLLRIVWKLWSVKPTALDMPRWMAVASKSVQGLLYLLLLAVPLTAIFGAWLEGHPVALLAGIQLPSPLATSHDLGAWLSELHTWLGDAILWVAGIHAIAAIYHHLVLKDDTLAAMLPAGLARRLRQ